MTQPIVPWDVAWIIFRHTDPWFAYRVIKRVSRRCRDWVYTHVYKLRLRVYLCDEPSAVEFCCVWKHLPEQVRWYVQLGSPARVDERKPGLTIVLERIVEDERFCDEEESGMLCVAHPPADVGRLHAEGLFRQRWQSHIEPHVKMVALGRGKTPCRILRGFEIRLRLREKKQ